MAVINNSDLGITCGTCGSTFAAKQSCTKELIELFNDHECRLTEEMGIK